VFQYHDACYIAAVVGKKALLEMKHHQSSEEIKLVAISIVGIFMLSSTFSQLVSQWKI